MKRSLNFLLRLLGVLAVSLFPSYHFVGHNLQKLVKVYGILVILVLLLVTEILLQILDFILPRLKSKCSQCNLQLLFIDSSLLINTTSNLIHLRQTSRMLL